MKSNRTQSVVDYKLLSRFDHVRNKLLAEKPADCLDKPLAFWTVPNDRRLPLAFMGRTIRDLLTTPFEELYDTPGVGQKKIAGLIDLLTRVATMKIPDDSQAVVTAGRKSTAGPLPGDAGFDAANVSESDWQQWRACIMRHSLDDQVLGRFASSLQDLPRVVWNTPLSTYTDLSLAEIRALKTHGEKRVRVVVEIFGALHRMLAHGQPVKHLMVQIRPTFVTPIEGWILDVLQRPMVPEASEIRHSFVEPIMKQIRIDAGEQIYRLADGRLGLSGRGSSVKQFSKKLGLTRARVYQLLNEIGEILQVRWPESLALVGELRSKFQTEAMPHHDLELFYTSCDIFFPQRRKLVSLNSNGSLFAGLEMGHPRQAE
jgi:hypothetical protein